MKWQPMIRFCSAAALLGAAATSQAQDEAVLYGRVVMGVDYQSNVYDETAKRSGSWVRAADNQWGTSMFGLRGTEDLGDGWQTIFQLESGFSAARGQSNSTALFNRRAFVGLHSLDWGTLTLGKNQPIADALWALDPTGQQFIGSATLVRGRNWIGHDNMVSYETPNWGGFSVLALTTPGQQIGSRNKLRKDAVSLTYSMPTVELRAIYDVSRDEQGHYGNLYESSKQLTLGGTLTLDQLKLFAGYEHLSAPDSAAGQPDGAQHYWVGARYGITSRLTLIGAAYRTTVNQDGGNANLFMLGADYSLSKRTLLYASAGRVRNSANANFSVEATNNNPAPGMGQTGLYTGIVHSF